MKLPIALFVVTSFFAANVSAQSVYDRSSGIFLGINGHFFKPGQSGPVTSGVTVGYRFGGDFDVFLQSSYSDLGQTGELTLAPALGYAKRFGSSGIGLRGNSGLSSTFLKTKSSVLWKEIQAFSDVALFRDVELGSAARFHPSIGVFAVAAQHHTFGGETVIETQEGFRTIERTETWMGIQIAFPVSIRVFEKSSIVIEPFVRSGHSTKWNGNRLEAAVSLLFNL